MSQAHRKSFIYLALAYILIRLPWLFTVPMQEAPDEFAHFWVIRFLQEHHHLPSAQEVLNGGPSAVYGSLPCLGYIPHILTSLFFPHTLALAARFGSLLSGLAMIYAAQRVGLILFPQSRFLAFALPIAVILHPQVVFLHSYSNSDSTASAIASILIWLLLDTIKNGIKFGRLLIIGVLTGWLALTKYSGLSIIPVLALYIVSSCFFHKTSLTLALSSCTISGLLALLCSSWWFTRNFQEFHGDFLGTSTMYKTWALTFHRDLHYYLSPWKIVKDLRWWRMTFFSFCGVFGYMSKYLWRPIYFIYLGFLIAALSGLLFKLSTYRKPDKIALLCWTSLALVVIINLGSMVWASTCNLGGPQGRYLLISEVPIMSLLIGGLSCFKKGVRLVFVFLLFNAITSLYAWIFLFCSYGGFHTSPL